MNDNTIIDYRTGENGKGIRLNIADIETLLFLFEHKLISQTQLYEFYILFKNIHYDSFRKRMSKFVKNKIIQFKKYEFNKKKSGIVKNLILLDTEGYEILYAAGLLKRKQEDYQNPTNWDRILATKEVVLHAIKEEAQRAGVLFGIEHQHPYVFQKEKAIKLIQEDDLIDGNMILSKGQKPIYFNWNPIIPRKIPKGTPYSSSGYDVMFRIDADYEINPDWILGFDEQILNIEIDTGYRTLVREENSKSRSVDEQLKRYINLANYFSKFKIELSVLYVYLDDSIPFRKNYGRKTQRIKNFKQKMIEEEVIRDSSLNIYVCSLDRSQNVIRNLLSVFHNEQSQKSIIKQLLIELFNYLKLDSKYKVSYFNKEKINHFYPLSSQSIEQALYITWKEGNQISERFLIPIPIIEGDIRSQNKAQHLSEQLNGNKQNWGLPYDSKVLMVYPDRESMKGDILRDDIVSNSVCVTNLEELRKYQSKEQQINFYDVTRRGEIAFEDATKCD